jgi:AmmeMemoRadiSam system protein B
VTAAPRMAAVAGRFYPGEPERARAQAERLVHNAGTRPEPALAIVAPHAGWMYSGEIAGLVWGSVVVPRRVIVLCPNHTGRGVRRSLWSGGAWQLPTGDIRIDEEMRDALVARCGLQPDRAAHELEHAIEVQLPLAQAMKADLRLTAVCLSGVPLADLRAIGEGLADAVRSVGEPVLLVASTDMSHYLAADQAAELDTLALERVLALDPVGLHETVGAHRISMCGVQPTTVTLFAALALGATQARLLRYGNSGETSGDYERVVGYAGVVVR